MGALFQQLPIEVAKVTEDKANHFNGKLTAFSIKNLRPCS